jgi:hypothetical protein
MDDVDEDQEMTGFRFPPEPIAGPLQSGSLSKYGLDDLDSDAVSEEDEAVDDTLEEARRLRLEDSMLDMEDPSFMPPDENSQSYAILRRLMTLDPKLKTCQTGTWK